MARFANPSYNDILVLCCGLLSAIQILYDVTFVISSLLAALHHHTMASNLKLEIFDRLVTSLVLLLRGVNLNDHCSWCHYLSCVPTSKWSCNTKQIYCEVSDAVFIPCVLSSYAAT